MIEESNPCCDVHSVASFLEGPCLVKFHLKMPKTLKKLLNFDLMLKCQINFNDYSKDLLSHSIAPDPGA